MNLQENQLIPTNILSSYDYFFEINDADKSQTPISKIEHVDEKVQSRSRHGDFNKQFSSASSMESVALSSSSSVSISNNNSDVEETAYCWSFKPAVFKNLLPSNLNVKIKQYPSQNLGVNSKPPINKTSPIKGPFIQPPPRVEKSMQRGRFNYKKQFDSTD